ncbi:hypothetical protein RF11_11661 [Thelohanellus kitauei]|uniref:Uncharacterized protein n=1 Tax=Thelohanellus kitauei TaxID=669202 RepID=A0A0C2IZK3_THEKT|nr:hypothetical protein RF11_11661 [Thelohanellus kitauei]
MFTRVVTYSLLVAIFVLSFAVACISMFLQFFKYKFFVLLDVYNIVPVILAISCVLVILQWVGIFGMWTQSNTTVYIYSTVFMILQIIMSIVTVVYIFQRKKIEMMWVQGSDVDLTLNDFANNSYINWFQNEKECCGITSKDNWKQGQYPSSCCKNRPPVCLTPFETPCAPLFFQAITWLDSTIIAIISAIFFLYPIVIIGMVHSRAEPIYKKIT